MTLYNNLHKFGLDINTLLLYLVRILGLLHCDFET